MANLTAKFVSAISAGLVVSAPLAAIPPRPLHAAEDCLSKPTGATPPGQHWYYRVVRGTNRHCWYLHEGNEAMSHASISRRARRSAIIAARKSEPRLTQASADARAELGSPPSKDEGPRTSQQTLVASDYPKGPGQDQLDSVIVESPRSLVSSRWPEPAGVTSAAVAPLPPASFVVASITPDSMPDQDKADQGREKGKEQGKADLTSSASPIALTTAEVSATAEPTSLDTLFLATLGAMTLTGFAGSSVYVLTMRRRPRSDDGLSRGPRPLPTEFDHTRLPSWLEPAANSARYVGRDAEF